MTLPEVAAAVRGTVVHDDGRTVTAPAFVDSRVAEQGGLFVAVRGENVDGHDFAAAAVGAGAAAVLSSRDTGQPGVVVDDVLPALASLARHVVDHVAGVTVVALTGSQGKTSTKDVLAQVLAAHATTVATYGSFNNELGLPLTVLRTAPDTRYLVIEMGARHVGDIAASCQVVPPQVSMVLNVGKAHIGEFGSQQAIARAKGEIVEALPADGVAVLNADDPLVSAMSGRTSARTSTFGAGAGADVRYGAVRLDALGRPSFTLATPQGSGSVTLQLVGEHHASNAAAVTAAALAVGVPLETVLSALGEATATSPARMQVTERSDGVLVVNDAYNANPGSMRAALEALVAIGRRRAGRTVAVLGEMLELGESSAEEHDGVGRLAARLGVEELLVVGEGARPIHAGASQQPGWAGRSTYVADTEAALGWLRTDLQRGDVVLLKASRDAHLRQVADRLVGDDEPAARDEQVADAARTQRRQQQEAGR